MRKLLWIMVLAMAALLLVTACGVEEDDTDFDEGEDLESVTSEYNVGSCNWWKRLSQSQRNHQIVIEALYSVDRNIWGQNNRIRSWRNYLNGNEALMGNWNYRGGGNGWGSNCKEFAREIVKRASGYATNLPSGTNYKGWFPYRNKADAIRHAQPGEILQFTGTLHHTAIIISNFHDGRFEIVHSNWVSTNKISKQVIDTMDKANHRDTYNAKMESYVINSSCH